EGADEEGALLAGETVIAAVAVDEVVDGEVTADGVDGGGDARVVGGEEVDEGDDEEGGVEVGGAWGAGEGAERGVVADVDYPALDGIGGGAGVLGGDPDAVVSLGEFDDEVEPDPRHDLGVYVLGAPGADLPDTVIGFVPALHDDMCDPADEIPGIT